jgi:hypothetical protein
MPSVTLSRTSFPFLVSSGARAPLQWNYGPLFNVLLTTESVRVSEAGVSWCDTCELHKSGFWSATARRASEVWGDVFGSAAEWYPAFACEPVHNALCASAGERNESVWLFPSSAVRTPVDRAQLLLPEALRGVLARASSCAGKDSNRQLSFEPMGYEASLCDLVHNKLQFVFFPETSTVAWRRMDSSLFWTVCVTLAVLFFFTRLCEYMSMLIRGRPRVFSRSTALVMWLALAYSFANSSHVDFATEEKLLNALLQWYTLVYLGAEALPRRAEALPRGPPDYAPVASRDGESPRHPEPKSTNTMGALVALQLIFTAHLQHSYDTPLLTILVLFFGARSFLKFLNFVLRHSATLAPRERLWKFFFLSLDSFVLLGVLELGVRSSVRSTSAYASAAAGLLLCSAFAGTFLHCVMHDDARGSELKEV